MEHAPVSILVIDGDSTSRNYMSAMLQQKGFAVLTASLGREGLISAWKDLPAVIILDPVLPDLQGLEVVSRLRQDRRTAATPILALSAENNPQRMNDLMAAGCNEYILKSGQAMEAILDLIVRLLQPVETPARKTGKLVACLSAKGGIGTSSLCANLAMCIASREADRRVAVVDLVLPLGSIANIVGYNEQVNIVDAALLPPGPQLVEFCEKNLPLINGWDFHLLAGPYNPEAANRLPGDRVEGLIQTLLGCYDLVFVDLGRSLSRIGIPVIQKANVIVLVLGTDLATATLTRSILDYLRSQKIDPQNIYAIQNRAVGLEGMTRSEVEKLIDLPIRATMPYMGGNFTVANNHHDPLMSRFPNDSGTLLLGQAANELRELLQRSRS
jgi:CheY-like chemotaxis protein